MTWAIVGAALSSAVGGAAAAGGAAAGAAGAAGAVGAGAAGAGALGAGAGALGSGALAGTAAGTIGAGGAAGAVGSLGAGGALSAGSVLGSGSLGATGSSILGSGAGGALASGGGKAALGGSYGGLLQPMSSGANLSGAELLQAKGMLGGGTTSTGPSLGSMLNKAPTHSQDIMGMQNPTTRLPSNPTGWRQHLINRTPLGDFPGEGAFNSSPLQMSPNDAMNPSLFSGRGLNYYSDQLTPSNDTMMKAYLGSKLLGGDKKQQQRSAPAISAPGRAGNPSAMMMRQPVGLLGGGRPQRRSFRR